MVPDIHADEDGPTPRIWHQKPKNWTTEQFRDMDNWICMRCARDPTDPDCCWDRSDEYIQKWIKEHKV
jgi:hypothetical protein